MVDSGYQTPTDRIFIQGGTRFVNRNVGVATNMYPGRLVVRELTDYDVKVSDGILPVGGVLGYEESPAGTRPTNISSIYTVDTTAAVHPLQSGDVFYMPSGLAAGTVATQNDLLLSWSAGQVIPGEIIRGVPALKIPFSKQTSEYDTGIDLPAGVIVQDVFVKVTTADASGTIDVGILSSESGGDADGFLDGETLAATGYRQHNMVDATAANNTSGVLLVESDIKSADSTALYYSQLLFPGYVTDGTAKSITYTTSNHTVAGYIYVLINSPGVQVVGRAAAAADASSAAANIIVKVGA